MINATGKKHIIFDFDKTLFWLDLDWDRYFDDIAVHLNKLDPKLLADYTRDNINWGDMQNLYVQRYGSSILSKITRNSSTVERSLLNRVVPNEELINFVKNIGRDITLSIWSSNSTEVIEDTLTQYNLLDRFKTIASRSNVKMLKPNAEGFYKIHRSQVDLSDYLMIGNSSADKLGAAAAGIDFHLVTMPQFK